MKTSLTPGGLLCVKICCEDMWNFLADDSNYAIVKDWETCPWCDQPIEIDDLLVP